LYNVDDEPVSAYDEIADWYDAWAGSGTPYYDAPFQAVEALMGSVAGRRVCDLACGQGRVARYLADRGASIVGVDIYRSGCRRLPDATRRSGRAASTTG
jgi:2-polyprenyl-3-methyl-5-hydroxy-6-metoxy-1,4-benzoquinol methylase